MVLGYEIKSCISALLSQALHSKLYGRWLKHPGDVMYVLVCRVVLGQPAVTVDGIRGLDGTVVFTTPQRTDLAHGKHSLRAELGGVINRHVNSDRLVALLWDTILLLASHDFYRH